MLPVIIDGYESPDATYFRTASAEPELELNEQGEQILKLVNGTGSRRKSWGQPGVTSTPILQATELVAIHVGFFHKHGGGQFYRYYRLEANGWTQVTWNRLTDEERTLVLSNYENKKAPIWAKSPGKLRTSYSRPELKKYTTYKIVQVKEDGYYSIYDGETRYQLGKRLAEKAIEEHGGGYYSYPTAEGVETAFHQKTLYHKDYYKQPMTLAIIECQISGTIVNYEDRKYASTYLCPVKELKRFDYTPEKLQEAS